MSKLSWLIASMFLLALCVPSVFAETRDLVILDDDTAPFIYTSEGSDSQEGFSFDLPASKDGLTKALLSITQSDGGANLAKVSSPRCAENNGGAADLYLSGKKLASFTQGDKGKQKRIFKNGDGGRFGQAYCCGCVYEHDVTALLKDAKNEIYFKEKAARKNGFSEIASIKVKVTYDGPIRQYQARASPKASPKTRGSSEDALSLLLSGKDSVDVSSMPAFLQLGVRDHVESGGSRSRGVSLFLGEVSQEQTRSAAHDRAAALLKRAMSKRSYTDFQGEEVGAASSFIAFLEERYGPASVVKAAAQSSKGIAFQRAIQQSTGKKFTTLQDQWIEYVIKAYGLLED